jgi:hypothetical protein
LDSFTVGFDDDYESGDLMITVKEATRSNRDDI